MQATAAKQQRLALLDIAKGLGILFVIYGHVGLREQGLSAYLYVWIYAFHIPLFFVLSGSTFRVKGHFGTFLWTRVKRLLGAYLFLYVLCYLLYALLLGHFLPLSYFEGILWGSVDTVMPPVLWFLPALFAAHVAFYWVLRLPRQWMQWALVGVLFAVSYVASTYLLARMLPFSLNILGASLLFMKIGEATRPLLGRLQRIAAKTLPTLAALLAGAAGCFALAWLNARQGLATVTVSMADGVFGNPLLFLGAALLGIFFSMLLAAWVEKRLRWPGAVLAWLGRQSLTLFAVHFPLLHITAWVANMPWYIYMSTHGVWVLVLNILITLVVCALSALLAFLLSWGKAFLQKQLTRSRETT